jgi:ElaA protein
MTNSTRWECKPFNELTLEALYASLQLRQRVFVVEQNCAYLDADGYDAKCLHLLGWNSSSLIAYARLIPPGVKYAQASIGRVATHPEHRGLGLGKELMAEALNRSRAEGWNGPLIIQAQIYLENFYEGFGFRRITEPYLEDGITHVDMLVE